MIMSEGHSYFLSHQQLHKSTMLMNVNSTTWSWIDTLHN